MYVVGKRFMRSINSLKTRPAFQMALLPSRHTSEPTWTDQQSHQRQPQKKKRLFYDHRTTATPSETRDDLDCNDSNKSWDENTSCNTSFSKSSDEIQSPTAKPHHTLRFIFNGRRHSQAATSNILTSKKTHGTVGGGGREIFQASNPTSKEIPYPKSKRESLSNLFGANRNKQVSKK